MGLLSLPLAPQTHLPQNTEQMASLTSNIVPIRPFSKDGHLALQRIVKRSIDIAFSAVGILALAPLLLAIALLVKVTSPGPVFYGSRRIGRNQMPFIMLKFRTMCVNADAQRDQLRAQANLEGQLFKLANDPRITPMGNLLRDLSLDELPQLFNVLLGDMSLVGPRPLPPDESSLFQAPYTMRFNVLPGITGLWQISGRSMLSFQQLCQLELQYVITWSVWQDMRILCQTLPAVVLRKGAC